MPVLRVRQPKVPPEVISRLAECDVIVCGDSRAARQIDPSVIFEMTGLKTINIATTAWDIYSVSKSLKEAGISGKTIVISTSFFQINDGAVDNGYVSLESFQDISFTDKMKLYRRRPDNLLLMQASLFGDFVTRRSLAMNFGDVQREINVEFENESCKTFNIDEDWLRRHAWYKSPDIDGIKRKLMEQALENLSSLSDCQIIIYNGPVSQAFMDLAKANGVEDMERSFDSFMIGASKKYGLRCYSFLDDVTLRDANLYYDPQHLCGEGVKRFSGEIGDILMSLPEGE